MNERKKLKELLEKLDETVMGFSINGDIGLLADCLLASGVIVTPCVAYNKKHEKYQTVHRGRQGHIFASKFYNVRYIAEHSIKERNNQ